MYNLCISTSVTRCVGVHQLTLRRKNGRVVEFFPMYVLPRTDIYRLIEFICSHHHAHILTCGWLLCASGDVSMVECRVLPEIACKYLVQIRHVSANCKRPPLHCYYITSRRCACLYAICSGAPSQQLYSSSFCWKLLFIGYRIDRYPWLIVACILLHTSLSNATAFSTLRCLRWLLCNTLTTPSTSCANHVYHLKSW